jgi:alpha-beta hydrolase superfamily lysophospholipase
MNIFLLRGLVREKEHWGDFKVQIESAFPNANIITPEIQGVGQFIDITSPDNFDEMIEFMRKNHIECFDNDQENILMAMSLGGMITRRWIELHQKDFKKIILVNTSFKGINPLFHRLKPACIVNFLKIFATPGIENRERTIVKMVSNNNTNHEKIIKNWIEIQNKRPVKRASFINQIKAALTFSPAQTWPSNIPLLILAGKMDRLCSVESSKKIHKVWGGELALHETAGHDLPIDDAPWMIEKIKNWLKAE